MATVRSSVDLKKLTEAAGRGDAKAQFDLGMIYRGGKGVVQDIDAAKKYLGMAAEQGHVEALYQLSQIIENHPRVLGNIHPLGEESEPTPTCEVTPPDPDPVLLMEKAANMGYVKAQCALARHFFSRARKVSNLAWEESREHEEPWECVIDRPKYLYYLKTGWDWVAKAAKNGDSDAQYWLASEYETGLLRLDTIIIESDMVKAAKWYKKSAASGHIDAQYKLGVCYEEGNGVAQDQAEAVKWYTNAATRLGRSEHRADAKYRLGLCYGNGNGVEQDFTKALEWLQKAAEQDNHTSAMFELGHYFFRGRGVKEDETKAMAYWEAAAERGHLDAQTLVYSAYSCGETMEKNEDKAEMWRKRIEGIPIFEPNPIFDSNF